MTHSVALLVTVLVSLMGLGAAQTRPDFSGRWTTDPDPATAKPPAAPGRQSGPARGDMGSGWGSTITITQDAARLIVEYAHFGRGDMQPPVKFSYALDGSESKHTLMMGRGPQTQVSRAAWDGQSLVITTIHTVEQPGGKPLTAEVRHTLSLDPAGSLVVEVQRGGFSGGPATSTRTVYRKLPPAAG